MEWGILNIHLLHNRLLPKSIFKERNMNLLFHRRCLTGMCWVLSTMPVPFWWKYPAMPLLLKIHWLYLSVIRGGRMFINWLVAGRTHHRSSFCLPANYRQAYCKSASSTGLVIRYANVLSFPIHVLLYNYPQRDWKRCILPTLLFVVSYR